uniref:sulfatase family protein n=1 Tax=uncultured Sphingomonas sp. TaxID=158754 RepID=UPI0035CC300A
MRDAERELETGIRRRDALHTLLGSAALVVTGVAAPLPVRAAMATASARPNIILIVSDQHRAGLSKAAGYPFDTSPRFDRLVRSGASFANSYATAPLCVPSRISMLTGRWPDAHRVRMNLAAKDAVYGQDLYDVAKTAGYRTGLAGKNHTYRTSTSLDFWREYEHVDGYRPPNAPPEYAAFDAWMHALGGGAVSLEPTPFPLEIQYPYRIVSDAIDFIDDAEHRPFLLQVSFPEPHAPQQIPKPYWDMFPPDAVPPRAAGPEALAGLGFRARWLFDLEQRAEHPDGANWRRYVSNYLGALRMVDDQLTRLLAHLDQRGLTDNTIIVYTADHGDYVMDYGLGRKGVGLCEPLTRIPLVFAGGGVKPLSKLDDIFLSNADIMPTLCEAMGQPIPIGVQGRSIWPILRGEAYPAEEFRSIYSGVGVGGLYYDEGDAPPAKPKAGSAASADDGLGGDTLNKVTQSGNQKMVRMGSWKLIYDGFGYGQLYDLERDPHELRNVFGATAALARQNLLMAELAMWTIRVQDSLPTGPQNRKYHTKWPSNHNWLSPYRRAPANSAFAP